VSKTRFPSKMWSFISLHELQAKTGGRLVICTKSSRFNRKATSANGSPSGGGFLRQFYATLTLSLMVLQVVVVLCAFAQPAYAYVDPGSGLLALQIIGTTFAGMIFMLRRHLGGFIRHMTGKSESKSKKGPKQ